MGLLPDVFWNMSWDEYDRAFQGYQIRQTREWERTRMICTQMVNIMAEKPIKPVEYMWLATDSDSIEEEESKLKKLQENNDFWDKMQANYFPFKPKITEESSDI